MHRLPDLTLQDMALCGRALRTAGKGAASMEEAAGRVTSYLYEELTDPEGNRANVLARFYKTHPFAGLEEGLQEFASRQAGGELAPDTRCLTLLSTFGEETAWCSRHRSRSHRTIPLPSAQAVEQAPMIAQLVRQLGLDVSLVVRPAPELLVDQHQHSFNVFYVEEAAGSPYIPAQADFVEPYGVRSVLGFGGLLPNGDLYAVILFVRVTVPRPTAQMFQPLALATKLAILPFTRGPVFGPADALDA